jgi:hypothetical protein
MREQVIHFKLKQFMPFPGNFMDNNTQLLCSMDGKLVTLVRPGPGTISDAMAGYLSIFTDRTPIIFQVSSIGMSTIFTIDDVDKLDGLFIHLKGPVVGG